MVAHGTGHGLDGLFRAVSTLLRAVHPEQVRDVPQGRLLAVAGPVRRLPLSHGVPAGLVLPVVMPSADRELLLAPDDLGAVLEPGGDEVGEHDVGVQGPVPDIGDVTPLLRMLSHP